ncbi:MAG: LuxR family transcriptional regulator [Candidatus Kapaibacterium sp.]|nr:tetratricopeptide repeat protein [Bacteroidota bacterium]
MHNNRQQIIAEIEQQLQKTRSKEKRIVLLNQLAAECKEDIPHKAVTYAEQSRQLSEELLKHAASNLQVQFYKKHLAKALHILAFCLRTTTRIQEAEQYALRAIVLYKELHEPEQVAFVQYHTGFLYWLYHRYQDALDMFRNAISTFYKVGNIRYYHNGRTSMSNTLLRLGKYSEAEEYLLESMQYARSNNLEPDLSVALVGLGNLYEDRSQFDKALPCYKESIELLRRIGSPINLAGALTGMGGICKILGNISESIEYNNEALSIYNQTGNITGAVTVMEILSGIYLHQGDFEKSIAIALNIIEKLEGTEYKRILAGAYNNIASVYIAQHNYLKSAEYFTKAHDIYAQIQDVRGVCFTNSNIAEVFSDNNQWHEALPYITTAWSMATENKFLDLEIEIASVYGKILAVVQSDTEALQIYNSTFNTCIEFGHKRGAIFLSMYAGNSYYRLGNLAEAEERYQYSLRTALDIGEKQQAMNAHKCLAELYERNNASAQALQHYKEFHTIERLLFNEQSTKRISYLQVLHETETAEKERDIFRLENEKLQSENEFKSKELSAMALHLVQKNEMLDTLRTKARAIVESYAEKSRQLAIEMVQQIESNIRDDNSWDSFNQQFTQLHSGFAQTLSERFPNLTPMELKICALLKIQLSTKEIAAALVLSTRTVEDHRNRMRKKFGLSKEENLATFLASL